MTIVAALQTVDGVTLTRVAGRRAVAPAAAPGARTKRRGDIATVYSLYSWSAGDVARSTGATITMAAPVMRAIGARDVVSDEQLGKVSIVGTGMQNTPGYASRMFRALYDAGINILLITTSEIRITCIIEEDRVVDAVRALHEAFALDQE